MNAAGGAPDEGLATGQAASASARPAGVDGPADGRGENEPSLAEAAVGIAGRESGPPGASRRPACSKATTYGAPSPAGKRSRRFSWTSHERRSSKPTR
jgi:hypothetical protein